VTVARHILEVDRRDRICKHIGVYEIRFARDVEKDLQRLPAFHRTRVIHAIETQLMDTPMVRTRNRKPLANLIPPWTAELPIWELRVGGYRAFYDVSEDERIVYVRAVRKKPAGMTTEEIL
jgi:mRNA-degrading endonuclease RelE of RelBE toxin-antitoxin system